MNGELPAGWISRCQAVMNPRRLTEPLALFRADASPEIGSGHIARCLTLARDLAAAGWRCAFACRRGTSDTVPALTRSGFPLIPVGEGDDLATCNILGRRQADLLVIDHYGLDAIFESDARRWTRCIFVVDDLADRPHDCDLLLDQTLGRDDRDYRPLVPSHCRLLLGPSFALLRPEFASARSAALHRRRTARIERVMISMGGTDPHDVAAMAVEGIALSGLSVAVDVVLGSRNPSSAMLAAADRVRGPVRLLKDVSDMAAMMAETDLAIGAGGVTSWERCCMGLPALVIVTAPNQELIAKSLARAEAAEVLGNHPEVSAEGVAAAVQRLADDPSILRAMSEAAAGVCDGLGMERTVAAVLEVVQ